MLTLRFNIGDAFPAEDPVARFITVLCMMSNDWLRLIADMMALDDAHPDTGAKRVWSFRQQAALHQEAATFITDARRRFPEIERFIAALPKEARDECDQVTGGVDPKSAHYLGDWLADHRNVTFHYPELHPDKAAHGKEEVHEALVKAAPLKGTITAAENFGSLRFGFADEVTVQWLPDVHTQVDLIARLRDSVMALGRLAQRTASAYLASRPTGTVGRDPD